MLSQLLNGLVAIPLVFLVLRIRNDGRVMANRVNWPLANTLGGATFGILKVVGAAAFWRLLR